MNHQSKTDVKQAVHLEEDIAELEKELAEKYYTLGKGIYEIAESRVGEINELVDRLVDTKVRLAEVKRQQICPHCLAQNPADHLYCGKCGRKMEQEEST